MTEVLPGPDMMLYEDGSDTSFRCDCGCNVFRRTARTDRQQYACNACGDTFSVAPLPLSLTPQDPTP